jgi:hypothetical protein
MVCPKCQGTLWTIYGVQFEQGGTLIEVFAECGSGLCSAPAPRLRLGVIDGTEIQPVT